VSTSLVLPAAIARLTLPALLSDYVRGKLRAGPDLPRMPPLRLGAELTWQGAPLGLTLAARQSSSRTMSRNSRSRPDRTHSSMRD
jgi:hypothetical protein